MKHTAYTPRVRDAAEIDEVLRAWREAQEALTRLLLGGRGPVVTDAMAGYAMSSIAYEVAVYKALAELRGSDGS